MEQRSNVFCHGGYKNQDLFIVGFFQNQAPLLAREMYQVAQHRIILCIYMSCSPGETTETCVLRQNIFLIRERRGGK